MPSNAVSPQVFKSMSVAFLECAGFLKLFPEWKSSCCSHCHGLDNHKIYIRPLDSSGYNADWYLCIEAIVCCGLYHKVRELPREWWVAKSIELGVKRDDGRGYIYPDSPEKD